MNNETQIESLERQMMVAAMAGRDDALEALIAKRAAQGEEMMIKNFRNLAKGDKVALYVTVHGVVRFSAPGSPVVATVTNKTASGYVSMRVPGRPRIFITLTAGDLQVEVMNS